MSTAKRVSDWNIKGGKPAPSKDDREEYYSSLIKQSERILEELQETYTAFDNNDRLEILDGICDLDVTINGLFFLGGFSVPEDKTYKNTYKSTEEYFMYSLLCISENVTRLYDEFILCVSGDNYDVDYIEDDIDSLYSALQGLIWYAESNFSYQSAIDAVLDNNDSKFYDVDDYDLAFVRANELTELTDEEHTVVITLERGIEDGFDVDNFDLPELMDRGAILSVHRTHDDKICKPKDFIEVDLKPFI